MYAAPAVWRIRTAQLQHAPFTIAADTAQARPGLHVDPQEPHIICHGKLVRAIVSPTENERLLGVEKPVGDRLFSLALFVEDLPLGRASSLACCYGLSLYPVRR